jgi:hypothetical protein
MVKSKFSFNIIAPLMVFGLVTFALYFLVLLSFESTLSFTAYFYNSLILFVWFCMIYGGFRTKAISVKINYNTIEVKRYFGLSNSKSYLFTDFSGFKTSTLASRGGRYEYLYLMQGEKKVIKISEYYHRNYSELKAAIEANTVNLGFEQFNIVKEVKEIFV